MYLLNSGSCNLCPGSGHCCTYVVTVCLHVCVCVYMTVCTMCTIDFSCTPVSIKGSLAHNVMVHFFFHKDF